MQTPLEAITIGRAVAELQQPPERIREAARELGITPVMTLNQTPYYRACDIELIAEHFYCKETEPCQR